MTNKKTKDAPLRGARRKISWQIPELPRVVGASLLEGDFGNAFLKEYESRALRNYSEFGGHRSLIGVLRPDERGIVRGNSAFAAVLANQILREEKLRTPTPQDAEQMFQNGILFSKDEDLHVITTAIMLTPTNGPDFNICGSLVAQLEERGQTFNSDAKKAFVIPYESVDLVNEDNRFGLGLKLREEGSYFETESYPGPGECYVAGFKEVAADTCLPIDPRQLGCSSLNKEERELSFFLNKPFGVLSIDPNGRITRMACHANLNGDYVHSHFLPVVYDVSSTTKGRAFYNALGKLRATSVKPKESCDLEVTLEGGEGK